MLGIVSPEDISLEHCQSVGSWHVVRAPHNIEPVLAVVVDRLDVVEQDVRPVDPLGHQVHGDPACFVDSVRDQGLHQGAVHVGAQDPVVVRDEHKPHLGVQGNVSGGGEVGGHDDGMVVALEVEDVDLLTKAVHHVQVRRDPVNGNSNGGPGTRNTENEICDSDRFS